MIHSKSLIRRLAYVPWLLAFGLVLGWAGEAQAQDIRLTVPDGSSLREDGGAKTFTVTATNYAAPGDAAAKANVPRETNVLLLFSDGATAGGGRDINYTITPAVITIPKDKDTGSADITITPIVVDSDGSTNGNNTDFTITIDGTAGGFQTDLTVTAEVLFIDTHKPSSLITLSVDPKEVKQNAGETTITVTGTINGEKLTRKNLTFPLIVVGATAFTQTLTPAITVTAPTGTEGVRDTDYRIPTMPSLTIPRKKDSGKATFTIDPKNGPVWIGIGTPVVARASDSANRPSADLRYDAVTPTDDPGTTDVDESTVPDGTNDAGTATMDEQEISVVPTTLSIAATTVADIKSDGGLTASPAMVREEDGVDGKEITLKVVLAAALPKDAEVNFTIGSEEQGTENASRDINFAIEFGDLTIPEGDTEGTTTAILTTFDDEATAGDRKISVKASVAGSDDRFAIITIVDSDELTENITLTADPATVSEDAGLTEVNITATIDGQVFDDDLKLTLVLTGDDATATRDVDYTATLRSLVIPAGEISGSKMIDIIPIDDGIVDADEKIQVTTLEQDLKNDDDDPITIGPVPITLKDTGAKAAPTDPDDTTPVFAEADVNASATAIEGVAGVALEDKVLPAATGDGDLTYSVSANLPDGLSFDTATRTLSGTPTAAGTTGIVYTVVDGDTGEDLPAESAVLTYNIEVSEKPDPEISVESVSVTQPSIREDGGDDCDRDHSRIGR